MKAAREASAICDQVEAMAGELEHYAAQYWELREVMDSVRAKVNAPEALADREVVKLVQVVLRTEPLAPLPSVLTAGR